MDKLELVKFISSEHCVTKFEAKRALEMVTDSITKVMSDNKVIELVGFGSFYILPLASREGRNLQTGEKIILKPYNRPMFRASKRLKDACNFKIEQSCIA